MAEPGNLERSWNDPPVFLHNTEAPPVSTSPVKRTALNKRVAHAGLFGDTSVAKPTDSNDQRDVNSNDAVNEIEKAVLPPLCPPPLGETGAQESSGAGIVLFPPTTTAEVSKYVAPIIVPNMSPTEKENLPIVGSPTATNPVTNALINIESEQGMPNFDDDEQMFHYVMSKLKKTLMTVQTTLQPKTIEDVKKKLEILSGMWESGSLSYPVKSGMARLATALNQHKCDEAHKIHMALMMDSVSEVGQWMVGVKRLIQETRATTIPSDGDHETNTGASITTTNLQNTDNQTPVMLVPNSGVSEASTLDQNALQTDQSSIIGSTGESVNLKNNSEDQSVPNNSENS